MGKELISDVPQFCVDGLLTSQVRVGDVPSPGACDTTQSEPACGVHGDEPMLADGRCVSLTPLADPTPPKVAELCDSGIAAAEVRCGAYKLVQWTTDEGETVRVLHRVGRTEAKERSRAEPTYCCENDGPCRSRALQIGDWDLLARPELSPEECRPDPIACEG